MPLLPPGLPLLFWRESAAAVVAAAAASEQSPLRRVQSTTSASSKTSTLTSSTLSPTNSSSPQTNRRPTLGSTAATNISSSGKNITSNKSSNNLLIATSKVDTDDSSNAAANRVTNKTFDNKDHNNNKAQTDATLASKSNKPKDWQLECKFTLNEIQQHSSLDDCWMVIFDKVYNITDFVFEHPGGDFILLEYAGRDATHAFLSSRHGSSAYKMLDNYWIGILVDEELYYSNNSSYCSVYSNLSWRSTPTLEQENFDTLISDTSSN